MRRSSKPEVYSITGARSGLSADVTQRTHRYLFSMGLRTVCFIGGVAAHGPLRWVLIACAIFLPYIAVVVANAGRESGPGDSPEPVTPEQLSALVDGEDRRDRPDPPT